MNLKMVIRILSISMALLFLGMVAPCLAIEATTPTSLDFGEVTVGTTTEPATLTINNPNATYEMTVTLSVVNSEFNGEPGECGFSVEPPQLTLDGGGSDDATVSYAPTGEGVCKADISVYYGRGAPILVPVEGTAVEAAPLTNIIIDGQDTYVLDFEYKNGNFSEWLDKIAEEAWNHGQYVWLVGFWTRRAYKDGKLDKEQMKAILRAAAHAKIPEEGVIKSRKEKRHGGRHAAWFGSHGGHHK